jgi:hypothetical protein
LKDQEQDQIKIAQNIEGELSHDEREYGTMAAEHAEQISELKDMQHEESATLDRKDEDLRTLKHKDRDGLVAIRGKIWREAEAKARLESVLSLNY